MLSGQTVILYLSIFYKDIMERNCFVVRVYGIYIDDLGQVLVSDEFIFGRSMTKFPGGGLEYGEGAKACLEREFLEETGLEFKVLDHFYTTDFFVASEFHDKKQLISIYFFVKPLKTSQFGKIELKNEFQEGLEGSQGFRWINLNAISEDDFTFPVDQHVAILLKEKYFSS